MGSTDDSRSCEQNAELAPEESVAASGEEGTGGEHLESAQHGERPRARKRRRVTTLPPAGSDPSPPAEPQRHAANENDERLKGDKPPHWG